MLNFKPININDKYIIDPYLKKNSQTCDRNFTNLFCWQHFYNTQWTIADNWLVLRACINGERRMAYITVSDKDNPDYCTIIPTLLEDAKKNNQPLTLMGLTDEECRLLENCCKHEFIFDKNRDFADYIYKSENLNTLKGRKYAQKRNHVNKFKSLYNYHYEPISKANIADCLQLEESWIQQHPDDESAKEENFVIKNALGHFEELNLIGGALYVENQIVAFTYGSEINETMFCTHVEKGDINYEGVYQMINYLFAQHLPEKYQLINREEDMGLPGLRKSKMSYEPEKLGYKTTALLMNDDMHDIINIWHKCFGNEDDSVYQFLSRYYFEHCSFVENVNNHIVSMLFMIPCNTKSGSAAYLYGVATDPEFQHRGYSSKLMSKFIEKCKNDGFDFTFLIPEEESLADFYAKFGYIKTSKLVEFNSDLNLGTGIPEKDIALVLPLKESFTIDDLDDTISCTPML